MTQQLGAPGQFAHAYVVGHEVGHHVQNLLGIIDRVDSQRSSAGEAESNALSVKLELQADCLAGVWANRAQAERGWRFQQGDVETAINAATQIGDDTLQRKARGTVVPESFTHGTSEQRVSWLKKGLATRRPELMRYIRRGSRRTCEALTAKGAATAAQESIRLSVNAYWTHDVSSALASAQRPREQPGGSIFSMMMRS